MKQGGNDFEIYNHPRIGENRFTVTGPEDTIKILNEKFLKQ